MVRSARILGTMLIVALASTFAGAETVFTASLDGLQSGTGSPGTGTGTVVLNDDEDMIDVTLEWSGLIGDQTLQHIHGPAMPGDNAGIVFTLDNGSPIANSFGITPEQVGWLKDELLYFNVHTTQYPAGEIRGQIVPEPVTLGLLALGAPLLLRRRHRA